MRWDFAYFSPIYHKVVHLLVQSVGIGMKPALYYSIIMPPLLFPFSIPALLSSRKRLRVHYFSLHILYNIHILANPTDGSDLKEH